MIAGFDSFPTISVSGAVLKRQPFSCFDSCKWSSNSTRLVQELNGDDATTVSFSKEEHASILGLKGLPKTEEFTFEVNEDVNEQYKLTKRFILSKISQFFDPNGFVSPVVLSAKLLMQAIWHAQIDWEPFILPPPISVPKNLDYSLQRIRKEHQQMLESWWKSVVITFQHYCLVKNR